MLKLSAVSLQLSDAVVLQDIQFSLQQGEVIGVIGPNGACKTSLLRLIQGALSPSAGQIYLQR